MTPPIPVLNPGSTMRSVLLVEDNAMDLDFCLQALRENAVSNPIVACRDGAEATDFIDAHSDPNDRWLPLFVLLDLRLPKVDGIEVLDHLRQNPTWEGVPVIVLTTSHASPDVDTAYRHGANSYIVKPVDFMSFSQVIRRINLYWILTNEPPPFAPSVGFRP